MASATRAPHPARFGRYEVIEPLGQGAMGAVYKARDPAIDRTVAIKTLAGPILAFPEHREEFLARFNQEARAAGRLSHPNIVSVFDVGLDEAAGVPYIVMEYVPGVTLATLLAENPTLPVDQALELVTGVAAALEEAHAHGIVHRDIKPGNIFVDTRGRVKVGDFGIARMEGSELTQTGIGLGTPGYAAPEVLRGGRADARSDVFSLGVVAYALLAGVKPFAGKTGAEMGLQVLQHEPKPPHELRPELPVVVSQAVMRALAKDPASRTQSVSGFVAELRGAVGATATALPPAPVVVPGGGRIGPRRAALALLALALLAGLGALAWSLLRSAPAPTPAPRTAATATPRPRPAPAATAAPTPRTPPVTIVIPWPGGGEPGGKPQDDKTARRGHGKKKKGGDQ